MRYIGNKTKLLGFIDEVLEKTCLTNGRALDAFAGTATVGSHLKSRGFEVAACDIMTYSYAFQRAYICADEYPHLQLLRGDPAFRAARSDPEFGARVEKRFAGQHELFSSDRAVSRGLEEALLYLESYLAPCESFITNNFSASKAIQEQERSFFTRENARRIDAVRHQLHVWKCAGLLDDNEFFVLLSSLLEGTDSVANTTGVYAAFIKSWQSNALKPLRLNVPELVVGTGRNCEAHQGDINSLIETLGHFDLVYLDPPYNTRQYSAYYHVPELLACGWFVEEPELRGKTGLIADSDKKSMWSTRQGCVAALDDLVKRVDASHVLMSYNSEGIIPEEDIKGIFHSHGIAKTYKRFTRQYARYRSDSDNEDRQYKTDSVTEYLYYIRLK